MVTRTYTKDFYALAKSIDKLSCGQARISDYEEDLWMFEVEIAPSGGLYKGGKFKFSFQMDCTNYPAKPDIICRTPMYHPNIDTTEGSSSTEYPNICVSLLDDWEDSYGFEDCVQALLFLFYQPNLEDPLCPLFSPDITEEEFEKNVKISLEGGDVEDVLFETNYGFEENQIALTDVNGSGKNVRQVKEDTIILAETNENIGQVKEDPGILIDTNENIGQAKEYSDTIIDTNENIGQAKEDPGILIDTNENIEQAKEYSDTIIDTNKNIGQAKEDPSILTDKNGNAENKDEGDSGAKEDRYLVDFEQVTDNLEVPVTVSKLALPSIQAIESGQPINLCIQTDPSVVKESKNDIQVIPYKQDSPIKTNILTKFIKSRQIYLFCQNSDNSCFLDSLVPYNVLLSLICSTFLKRLRIQR